MFDILLKGGFICNGTGDKGFIGDVAIEKGKIAQIAASISAPSKQEVDCSGLIISPGFIDMHSHSDDSFITDSLCQSKIHQGVATEVTGQCGSSLFPAKEKTRQNLLEPEGDQAKIAAFRTADFASLLAKVKEEGAQMATNLVQLVGHNAIRNRVVGLEGRPSTAEETAKEAELLDISLSQGAWGVSLGLEYMPGIFAEKEELFALGRVCKKHNAIMTVHMRDEGVALYEAVDEVIAIAKETGAHLHIAHLKLSSPTVWGQAQKLLDKIAAANKSGAFITMDIYPYNACSTGITNILPEWSLAGGSEGAYNRIAEGKEDFARIYSHFQQHYPTAVEGERIYIVSTYGACTDADDKRVSEIAALWGLSVPDTLVRLLKETKCRANCIFFNMHEDDVKTLMAQHIAIGSDGTARPLDPARNDGKPHPRNFGTFPRFLAFRRKEGFCTIEEAVARITALPAKNVGLTDRGLLQEGLAADITVFNGDTIEDRATFANPFQKPVGIEHVIINGEFIIKAGVETPARPGKYLVRT